MRSKPVMLPVMRSLCRVRKRSMTVLRMRFAKNIMPETVMERLYFGCGQRPRCALSVLCVCLGSRAACLPAPRDGGDDASQRIEVARINDFAWRMRITQRPSDGHVEDRKSTRLNSSHGYISYAVFCLKKKKKRESTNQTLRRI